jgi:LuxR family maltose regulon positive regulatory protein
MKILLATKLHRPSSPTKQVQRPHLIRKLNEGLQSGRQLTLVSAPAGFGKTTCISEWINTLERWPVSWLSLDPGDDDPGRFFAYFIAALQKVDASLGREIEGILRSGQFPPGEVISTTLSNDILALEERFLLVLDDFHVIQDDLILQFLENLVTNLPSPLHLVLVTREDPPLPLARLRANNQLTEIRAKDLHFTAEDTHRFMNEIMGLSLSQTDLAILEDKTEGWVAGLQLAALSIRDRANPSSFIATLSGSYRFILSYLTEEVLSQQPKEIQDFLLETSILNKLNGDLCNQVTGREDSHALLDWLFNANLFLIPLDNEQQWYRYHHLFADLLRELQANLQKDKRIGLHQRASQWYARTGEASLRSGERGAFVNEAIQHALIAEDYAMVVALLESHAMEMIMQGYAKTVNGWVQALPEEWSSQSPRTDLAFAWMHLLRGAYSQASPYLERLERSYSSSKVSEEERQSLKAEWLVMQSLLLNMQKDKEESLDLAKQALEIVPKRDNRVRSLAYFGAACAYQSMEYFDLVVEAYQMAIQHARAADNTIVEMMSTSSLAVMALERGQLNLAFEIVAPVSDRVEESGSPPPISTVVYGVLGEVYYQWHQTEQARHHFVRALQLSTLGGYKSGMINCRVLLSRLAQLEGDLDSAAQDIQKAVDLMQVDTPTYVRQEAISQQVRLFLARNLPDAAQMALQGQGFSFQNQFSYPDLPPDQRIPHSIGLLYNSSLCVLLHKARNRVNSTSLRSGVKMAGRLIAGALKSQSMLVALETRLLRAQMHAVLGDDPASQADYASALEMAEPEEFISVFIEQGAPVAEALADLVRRDQLGTVQRDYVKRILAAFTIFKPQSTDFTRMDQPALHLRTVSELKDSVEPLTSRELEVLRLMGEGLKYKEIAERLFISLNTVRSHVKAIYGKLNVNNRIEAIKTANRLQIL